MYILTGNYFLLQNDIVYNLVEFMNKLLNSNLCNNEANF